MNVEDYVAKLEIPERLKSQVTNALSRVTTRDLNAKKTGITLLKYK